MFDDLVPIAFFAFVAFGAIGIAKTISDGRTRRRLIEAGASPELAAAIVSPPSGDPGLHESLKWGLVMGAVGLALVIIQFLPYQPSDPIVYGLVLLFAAAGLLGYYVAARRIMARAR
jgi:hypothetical protein